MTLPVKRAHRQQDKNTIKSNARKTARYQHVQEEVVGIVVEEVVEEQRRCEQSTVSPAARPKEESSRPTVG